MQHDDGYDVKRDDDDKDLGSVIKAYLPTVDLCCYCLSQIGHYLVTSLLQNGDHSLPWSRSSLTNSDNRKSVGVPLKPREIGALEIAAEQVGQFNDAIIENPFMCLWNWVIGNENP